jgi:hypothetical protein
MKSGTLTLMLASSTLAAFLVPRAAEGVNCDQVRRYLQTGRSAEDIADTMVISVEDVKKCQQSASGQQKGEQTPAPTPAPHQ